MTVVQYVLIGLVLRQAMVLAAMCRSWRFLSGVPCGGPVPSSNPRPAFFVVVPVLRETANLRQTVAHFKQLAAGHVAEVVVVTTARETAEARLHSSSGDTVLLAQQLAREGGFVHLHYPDPNGLKGDQVNFAIEHCIRRLPSGIPPERAFLLIYDADSRPPQNSLAHFQEAIEQHPAASVFHQSSRFELRRRPDEAPRRLSGSGWRAAVAGAGALRANRFVLGFELPRLLNRTAHVAARKRWLCSSVYTHVTGHGLCIRLSLLRGLPLPSRSPLEDMHYSFVLGSRNVALVPLRSLDCAEVPPTVGQQFHQLTRWFYGPARFLRYLSDSRTRRGSRASLLAMSAALITAEWLGCAILPWPVAYLATLGHGSTSTLAWAVVAIYAIELVIADRALGQAGGIDARAARLLAYPITLVMFGLAGWVGLHRLMSADPGVEKTERSTAP